MPPDGCYYITGDAFNYGTAFRQWTFVLKNSDSCVPFPALGDSIEDDFDATVDVALSNDGGITFPMYEAPAHVRVKSVTTYQETQQFKIMITQSEIVQMDVAGGSLPTGVMLRQSPVLTSSGSCSSGVGSSGLFDVSGNFSVYTELSMDTGQSWIPGSSSFGLILGGGSTPVRETTWGRVKAAYR